MQTQRDAAPVSEKTDVEGAAPPAPASAKPKPVRARFDHLDGCRTFCSFWVVMEHHASTLETGDYAGGHFAPLFSKGNAPVSYFIVLSGFVMSYAYGERDFDGVAQTSFYIRRFGRVGLTYYCALLFQMGVTLLFNPYYREHGWRILPPTCNYGGFEHNLFGWGEEGESNCSPTKGLLTNLLMAQACFNQYGMINATSWTVSTLVCLWFAYPYLQPCLRSASNRQLLFVVVLSVVLCWAVTLFVLSSRVLGPAAEQWWVGYGPTDPGWQKLAQVLHLSPVLLFPEYLLGLSSGLLCRRGWHKEMYGWSAVATVAVLLVPVLASLPNSALPGGNGWIGVMPDCAPDEPIDVGVVHGRCSGRSVFYEAVPAPLFALWMYASCTAVARATELGQVKGASFGPVIDFVSSPVLSGIGKVSFQVYLFQESWAKIFKELTSHVPTLDGVPKASDEGDTSGIFNLPRDSPNQAVYFVTFLLCLYTFAAAFVNYVEDPVMVHVMRWMARAIKSKAVVNWFCAAGAVMALLYWGMALGHTGWLCYLSVYGVSSVPLQARGIERDFPWVDGDVND